MQKETVEVEVFCITRAFRLIISLIVYKFEFLLIVL